jgi:hypothetical protein
MLLQRSLLSLCFILFGLPVAAQPSGGSRWVTLTNEAGARVEYPPALFPEEKSGGSNKQAFATADYRGQFELFLSLTPAAARQPSS